MSARQSLVDTRLRTPCLVSRSRIFLAPPEPQSRLATSPFTESYAAEYPRIAPGGLTGVDRPSS